jgi:CheY-like chemotaxis protein
MTDMPDQTSGNRSDLDKEPSSLRRAESHRPVLVVEDEMLIQMLAVEYLEELGFQAQTASSAAEAKSRLAALHGQVAAVLVDIGLPDAPGDVLVSELRAVYPDLPVIFASGQSEATLREQFKGQRAISFLAKPYVLEQMRSALGKAGILG